MYSGGFIFLLFAAVFYAPCGFAQPPIHNPEIERQNVQPATVTDIRALYSKPNMGIPSFSEPRKLIGICYQTKDGGKTWAATQTSRNVEVIINATFISKDGKLYGEKTVSVDDYQCAENRGARSLECVRKMTDPFAGMVTERFRTQIDPPSDDLISHIVFDVKDTDGNVIDNSESYCVYKKFAPGVKTK